jgi:nicotinamidase-related amidase
MSYKQVFNMVSLGPNRGNCSELGIIVTGVQTGMTISESRLHRIETITSLARDSNALIIWCSLQFRRQYPEIGTDNQSVNLQELKTIGLFQTHYKGSSVQILPQDIDIVLRIMRNNALYRTDLEAILRTRNINTVAVIGGGSETKV